MRSSAGESPKLSVRGALLVTFINRYAVLALSVASLTILARLVTPAQTGLFSVAASVMLLAQGIRDFGIAEFLVQEKELTQGKIRTAFAMNLILAWSLGAIIFLARDWIADVYDTPELATLIAIGCGTFLVAPFSSTVLALLNRRMDFVAMFKISLAGNLAGTIVSIPLAWLGWGAMALSLGVLATSVTNAVVTSLFMRSWDHFVPSLREWRKLASFGAYISGANVVNQFGGRVPELIIGRVLGFDLLGQFNRAKGIVALVYDMVVSGVNTVAFPAFAAAHRAGEDVRAPYLKATTMITGAILPVLAVLSLVSEPLIRLMLGSQWLPAARLMPWLILGTALSSLAPISAPVLSATGGIRLVLRSAVWSQLSQVVLMALLVNFGILWLSVSQALYGAMAFAINAYFLNRGIGITASALLRASVPSIGVTLVAITLPLIYVVYYARSQDAAIVVLAAVAGLATFGWLVGVFAIRHPIAGEIRRTMHLLYRTVRPRNA